MADILNNSNINVTNSEFTISIKNLSLSLTPSIDFKSLSDKKNFDILCQHILDIDAQQCNFSMFNKNTLIVFPVKLKNNITIIHRAQIQTLKLLQNKFDVKIDILIVGGSNNDTQLIAKNNRFSYKIQEALDKNGIVANIIQLHNISTHRRVQNKYIKLQEEVQLKHLETFKIKNYENKELKKQEFLNETVSSASEVLNIYAYICSNNEELNKLDKDNVDYVKQSIILAGEDESQSWYTLFDSETLCKIFGIFIPRLSTKKDFDFDQNILEESTLKITKIKDLLKDKKSGKWLIRMFFLQRLFAAESENEITYILKTLKYNKKEVEINFYDEDCIKNLLSQISFKRFIPLITKDNPISN